MNEQHNPETTVSEEEVTEVSEQKEKKRLKSDAEKRTARHAASARSRRERQTTAAAETASSSKRTDVRGARRGQYRFAAWVGLVVMLLAAIGFIFILSLGIQAIHKATDHTELKNELADLADTIIEFKPAAFETIDQADQNTLLLAAICRIAEKERIRMLQQKTDQSLYLVDDYDRLIIPIRDVNESFALLFGDSITPTHRTIGEEGSVAYAYEYDKANACYHVPRQMSPSMYTTVVDEIEVKGNTARIRVGYALTSQLDYDNKGELIPPTTEKIETYRWLVFTETEDDRWILSSVSEETPSTTAPDATTTQPGNVTMPSVTRTTTTTEPTTTTTDPSATTTTAEADE